MRIYLSGPMSGLPEYNFPAFNAAARDLRDLGHEVVNPAEMDPQQSYEDYMRQDIAAILGCDAMAVLPGYMSSRGCGVEVSVASAIGLPIYDVLDLTDEDYPAAEPLVIELPAGLDLLVDEDETVLAEADRLVSDDRGADYGHPLDDFSKTAKMWSAIFGIEVQPEQVPLAMIAVKISRELNKPKRDNLVDIAGYAKTLHMVHERRAELASAVEWAYEELAST